MALTLLASAFALTSCDLSAVKSVVKKIPGATELYHKITGTGEKAEKEETEAKVLSVKINSDVSVITDETEPFKLSAKVEVQGNASKEVTWSSSDSSVATVNEQGLVTPKSAGKFTVTAASKADSSKSDSKEIEVVAVPGIASVSIEGGDQEVILHTGTVQLKAVVAAKGSAAKGVSWSSDDETIAVIDEMGVATFKSGGKVKFTATSKYDKTKSGSVTFTVLDFGLHPELLEDDFEYSKEFPSEKLAAFLGQETFSFETPEGFYYYESPAEEPDPEDPTDLGSPASATIIVECTNENFLALDTAAGQAEYFWYYNHLYYEYGYVMNCYIDPTQSFEFKVMEDPWDEDLLDISISFTKDYWEPAAETEDNEWNESVSEGLTAMGVELPFVKLGAKYEGEYSSKYEELLITDSSVDFNKLNGYGAVLEAAEFEKLDDGYYRKLLADGTTYEFVEFYFCEDGNSIFVYTEAQFDALPVDAMKAYFASKGFSGEMTIPLYEAADSEAYFTIEILTSYYAVNIFNSTKDEMDAYAELVDSTEGWSVKDGRYTGDYEANFGDEQYGPGMYIENWLEESIGAIRILCFVTEPPKWPTESIASALAELGITDTLPEYSGEATDYTFNASNLKVSITVGAGNEADALVQYKKDLADALYTEGGADEYGDMHYVSPNAQLDVCPWDGSLWGSTGKIIIDLKKYVAPAAVFPLEQFNSFLTLYEFGFTVPESALTSLVGDSFTATIDAYYPQYKYYPYIQVSIGGVYVDEYVAVLQPIMVAAGYTLDESNSDPSENSYIYRDANEDFQCGISEYNGFTILFFLYYGPVAE